MNKVEWIETLYEFDGPMIFVGVLDGAKRLFCAVREQDGNWGYLASAAPDEALEALRTGGLSVRGALESSDDIVSVDLDPGLAVRSMEAVSLSDVPAAWLPTPGYGLSHTFGTCPDRLEGARASL